jgi:DNA primase catalytic subunit
MEEKNNLKEDRIRAITKLYYWNPKVQQALLEFAVNRETVPRYFEGFGKRPDTIQYPSDIMNLVNKGATSFHTSEEIWNDPLAISTDFNEKELNNLRKGWDLLIDIDSPYLDVSRIAAKVLLEALEYHGIKNYGIKFSGSKGFHIIIGSKAFPKEYEGEKIKDKFPEWPRAIVEYLFDFMWKRFQSEVGKVMTIKREEKELEEIMECKRCEKPAFKGEIIFYKCKVCGSESRLKEWKTEKVTRRCGMKGCNGVLEMLNKEEYFYCENCKDSRNEKWPLSSDKNPEDFQISRREKAAKEAEFDLVLVAPRHLFRMPYSLHEKTALASVVLLKEELESFNPRDAHPMKIKIRNFNPNNFENEASKLLKDALNWKKAKDSEEEKENSSRFQGKSFQNDKKDKEFEEFKFENVNEKDFPEPIKRLLKGLEDGKKRGLFILITFLRCINYTPEQINNICREWNKRNAIELKEGYIRSQIEWHLKQKRKILPPNYVNDSFYKDLKLIDKKQETKNPLVDMIRNLRKR